MNTVVSIIIPCFNHGIYLQDALDSIAAIATPHAYEIIIVNDGSDDEFTIKKLAQLEASGYHVINQHNQGLAAARNSGIKSARGKYIIPLDSDNKLHENYLIKAIDLLESNSEPDVIYGNRILFGEENRSIVPGEFNFPRILNSNYIDACTVYRKSTWERVGGYDGNMPAMGHEDWDFWVNISLNGGSFYYLNDVCFYYRVTKESMRLNITNPNFERNKQYIIQKHATYFYSFYKTNYKRINYIKSHRIKAGINLIFGRLGI